MADPRHAAGKMAEELVADWLASAGWQVLARRWRTPGGELDLVCREPSGILVGVEVRLRRSDRAGGAEESVTRDHLRRLRGTLAAFAAQHRGPIAGLRLDLVGVRPAPVRGRWILRRQAGIDAW